MEDKKEQIIPDPPQVEQEVQTEVSISNPEEVRKAYEDYNRVKYNKWRDKVNFDLPTVQTDEQKPFQEYLSKYEEKKFGNWQLKVKTNKELTEEQKRFNEYISLLQQRGNIKDYLRIVVYDGPPKTYQSFINDMDGGRHTYPIITEDWKDLSSRLQQHESYVLFYVKDEKINDRTNMSMLLYTKYDGTLPPNQVTFKGIGYTTGTDNIGGGQPPVPPPPQPVELEDYIKKPEKYALEIEDLNAINDSSFRKTNSTTQNQPKGMETKNGIVLTLVYSTQEMVQIWYATDNTTNRQRYYRQKRNGNWSTWSLISHNWTLPEWENTVKNLNKMKYSGTFRTSNSMDTIKETFPNAVKENKDGFVEYFKYETGEDNYKGYQKFLSLQAPTAGKIYERYNQQGGENNWSEWTEVGGGQTPPPQPPQEVIDRSINVKGRPLNKTYDEHVRIATGDNRQIILGNDFQGIYNKVKAGTYLTISYDKGSITDNHDLAFTIYGRAKGTIAGLTNQITIDGLGYSTGIDSYTRKEIDDKIDDVINQMQPPVPPPTPGGGDGGLIIIPPLDREHETTVAESGEYGLNIIDYRKLSRSPQIGVAGQYVKVKAQTPKGEVIQERTNGKYIFNKYKHLNGTEHNSQIYGGSIGISGIKKDIEITFNDTWKPLPKTEQNQEQDGELIFKIIREEITGDAHNPQYQEVVEEKKFTSQSESSTFTPTHHGRYQIILGTDSTKSKPADKYMLEFRARYGTIEPKGLQRNFEFKNYNGHILRANHKIKDEYKKHKLGNSIVRKVGIAKFTDLLWYHSIDIQGGEPHYIYAKVPSNCKVPTSEDRDTKERERKDLGSKIMTNNLSEVLTPTDEHIEKLPVDKNQPYMEQYIVELPWGDKQKPEWCFILLTTPENAKRWWETLSETEITYELKDEYQKPIYLQEGGFDITLSNGGVIHSYDYKKIEDVKKENAYLFTHIDGTTQKISKLQITSITPNIK